MMVYEIHQLEKPVRIDSVWNKHPWDQIPSIDLSHHMGEEPLHFPIVQAKLAYNPGTLFVIFQVVDRFVCSHKCNYQDRVCEDSCVEFFFTPGEEVKEGYFNLEINCGGTAFFHYQNGPNIADSPVSREDFNQMMIAHSLPEIVDPEIVYPTTWVVEYGLPFSILANYASVRAPDSGVIWRANFYKCADLSSHPHWLTWAPVESPIPDFHCPESFGCLRFR